MDERTQREKQRLRQALRELTNGLPEAYISRSDLGIEKNLLALEEWKQARSVFIYVSTGREPDTRGMLKTALDSGKTVAVPRVTGGGQMEARVIKSLDDLHPGKFGIPEPDASARLLLPGEIDLAVVPCIAADRQGYRLGHGGGYYDRYLAQTKCTTVCLCRGRLLQNELPRDAFDMPINSILTENACINIR